MAHQAVFTIPCNHPLAKDGVFHCLPSFYDVDHMRGNFEYLLADTGKVIEELRRNNPDLLQHAEYKFRGETVADCLDATSSQSPQNMGHWTYSPERGLSMTSGQEALIKLVQELDLPCFPLAIEKATGWPLLEELRAKIGYDRGDINEYLKPNFVRTPRSTFRYDRPDYKN